MVYLNRIYTRTGDSGETSLGDGRRVPKTHPRIVACGAVDEVNAALGLCRTAALEALQDGWLAVIQNDLFDLGADLCVPATEAEEPGSRLRITPAQVAQLEQWIDHTNESLQPLTSFILPGGTPASAWLHLARTVCRRAETDVWRLAETEPVSPAVVQYLNRLSDLLFVLGQFCNDCGRGNVLWVPGGRK